MIFLVRKHVWGLGGLAYRLSDRGLKWESLVCFWLLKISLVDLFGLVVVVTDSWSQLFKRRETCYPPTTRGEESQIPRVKIL